MARCGNHGQVIPRDRDLLHRLYWEEQRSLPEIGRLFGVTHKSVARVMAELGIKRRKRRSQEAYPDRGCIICGAPVFKIRHAGNGCSYGRRCKAHWNEHTADMAAKARTKPHVKAYKRRWYVQGVTNPEGESQWITKARALLRTTRRTLASRAVSQFPNEEF